MRCTSSGAGMFCTTSWDMIVTCTIIGVEVSITRDVAFSPSTFPLGNVDSSHLYRWSSWLSKLSQLVVPLIWATLGPLVLDQRIEVLVPIESSIILLDSIDRRRFLLAFLLEVVPVRDALFVLG